MIIYFKIQEIKNIKTKTNNKIIYSLIFYLKSDLSIFQLKNANFKNNIKINKNDK